MNITATRRNECIIKSERINPQTILDDVCVVFEQQKSDLLSSSRERVLVLCRVIYGYVAAKKTSYSFEAIAHIVCRRDHTAINFYIKKAKGYLRFNDQMFMTYWDYYLENSKLFTHYDFGSKPPLISSPCPWQIKTEVFKIGDKVTRKNMNTFAQRLGINGEIIEKTVDGRNKVKWEEMFSNGRQHSAIHDKHLIKLNPVTND